jgi:hypothetical protein|tara:strand:- start:7378 stop:7722 length:345 start_codon:yes stop_codon:yes gene_type:complete
MTVQNTRLDMEQKFLSAAVLTLVIALAWNNAFSELFKSIPVLQLYGPWVYAFVLTIVVVFAHRRSVNSEHAAAALKAAVRKELLKEVPVTEDVVTETVVETFANQGNLDFSQHY